MDDLNKGIDTDRFFCHWELESEHVKNHLKEKFSDYSNFIADKKNQVLHTRLTNEFIEIISINMKLVKPVIFIEVPSNFIEMKKKNKALAVNWRMQTREVFQNYFDEGYTGVDFVIDKQRDPIRCYHILKKKG
jgi:predicted GNAT superfamily acetyltransferase